MADQSQRYIRYSDDIEQKQPNEDEDIAETLASFGRLRQFVFEKHRHAVRDAHAKSHGILKGTLTVYDDLPEPLAQGVFKTPRAFPIIVRFSTSPGDIAPDSIAAFRGMAVKILGVEGRKVLPEEADAQTQDFLLVNHPVIPTGDVSSYLKQSLTLEKMTQQPEPVQKVLADVSRAAGAARAIGFDPAGNAAGQAKPETHILGETFFSMAALRYGDYVAKIQAVPLSENLQPLRGLRVDTSDPSALRELVIAFFRENVAEYELRVQLCRDLKTMPVEDGSVRWPEEESSYQAVARIALPAQEAYSPARRVYADDVLTFNPWHCLPEHRPLGSIQRVRRSVYDASSQYRHEMNAQPRIEPERIEELPD